MLLANFNLTNEYVCTARDPIAHYYAHVIRVFGEINFGDLVKNSPIHQIKIPAKVSGYTVWSHMRHMYLLPYAWSALYTLNTHTVRLVIFVRDLLLHFPQVKTQFRPRNSCCPRVRWTNHVSIHPTWNYLSSCQIEACQQVCLCYCWSHPGNQSAR